MATIVKGTTKFNNAQIDGELLITSNTIKINTGETSDKISQGTAGIEISRGTSPSYKIIYDESDQQLKVGLDGDLKNILTTSSIKSLADIMYPIGSIYCSVNSTNPSDIWVGTTWEAMPAGRVLLAQGQSDWGTNYAAGLTGGEAAHQLTNGEMPLHNHEIISNWTGTHTHDIRTNQTLQYQSNDGSHGLFVGTAMRYPISETSVFANQWMTSASEHSHSITINNSGSSQYHNNMQPYLSVYMWKRVS